MAIEGIQAHIDLVQRTSLRVADVQSANLPDKPSGTVLESDTVTLSAVARALLAEKSVAISFDVEGNLLNTEKGAPGLFIRSDFSDQTFAGTDLTGAVFSFANLTGADFSNAVLRNTSFTNAELTNTVFFGADLRGANLAGATGLTADQLVGARIDVRTVLPVGVLLE